MGRLDPSRGLKKSTATTKSVQAAFQSRGDMVLLVGNRDVGKTLLMPRLNLSPDLSLPKAAGFFFFLGQNQNFFEVHQSFFFYKKCS